MNVAITGHTRGIGKAISDAVKSLGWHSPGFSKSTGYDIVTDHKQIADSAQDCDVFVNNAYALNGQVDMFESIFELWRDQPKTIINIGSRSKYYQLGETNNSEYTKEKQRLHDVTMQKILYAQKQCRIININPGFVDTDMTAHRTESKMSTEQLADIIIWCVRQPHQVEIGELSVWLTTLDG